MGGVGEHEVTTDATLRELVSVKRAELGLSYRKAAEKSQGMVSSSHIGYIERGIPLDVSDRILAGLSLALDIPLPQLRRAAGLTPRVPEPFVLPERASRLTSRERRLVMEVVDTLLAAHSEGRK